MEAVSTRYLRKLSQHRLSTYVLIGLVGVLLLQFGESAGPKFNWLAKHKNRSDYKSFYLTAVDKFENDNSLYHLHRGGLHNLRPDA